MAEKEIEIENVDETSASLDANIDADALAQAEAEAEAAQAVESTTDAQTAPKTPAPAAEKPKTARQKSDELFNRVLMGRDKDLNNLLNRWGKDKFYKLITENPKFREDFYKDISGRGIKIPVQEYRGYYTPEYEQQKNIVYSDEGVKQARAEEEQKKKDKRQAEAEAAAEKNKPWFRAIPDILGDMTKQGVDTFKKGLDYLTEAAGKSKILEPLGVNKAIDYFKDSITSLQRGSSFGEAVNETTLPGLATGSVNMDFDRIAKQMKDYKEYGPTNVELDFQKHEGAWDTVSDFAKMIIPTIWESGATLIRSGWEEMVITGVAGAPEIGGLMAAYQMELFATIVDELEQAKDKNGYALFDVTKGEDWRRAFSDKAFIDPILKKANTRAAIVTGFDVFGAGVLGNVGSKAAKVVQKATKVLPASLRSPIAKGLSKLGQSKKVFSHPTVKAFTTKLGQAVEQAAKTKVGKVASKAGTEFVDFLNPREFGTAMAGEATAQYVTTGKVDPESTFLEGTGETAAIKMIARLLGKGRGVLGGGTTAPSAPPAPGSPPAPGVPPATPASDTYYTAVSDEEYAAYKKDKTLDPDRRAGVEEDAIKALDDPEYLKSLQKDIDTDESTRRYYEMVTDAMEQEAKYREGEEIMKASIAHVSELNGGISEKEMLELIDPSNPRFNKDLAGMVERKYAELANAYADDTGDESFRQKPAAPAPAPAATTQQSGAAQTQAVDTRGLAPEIQKGLAALQKLEEYVGRIDANLSSIEDTPANQAEIQKILATKKAVLQEIEKNKQALKQQGYDTEAPAATETEVVVEDGEAPQVPGQGTVVTEEAVDELPVISPEIRALAAQELDPKKLVKDGTLVYKNRKPVYNGMEFKSTKELQAFLQTDEGILAAAETNEAIANALGKTPTFTGTTETGVAGTSQTGPAAESVVGTQTAEGATETAPVEPATQKTEDVEVQAEGVDERTKKRIEYLEDAKAKIEARIKNNPDSPDMPRFQKALDKFNKDLEELKKETSKPTKPEGKPRVKGDGQEVVEAFEKAVAAGKKISFPVSGGRTTVQLDKPGQLKADEDGGLYIDRGKGKREYLPAGGGEESVIRQQLGVAETAESKKQRKEAVAERNKKAKEQADQKRKSEEAKQAQKKRDMIDRLQKILDTGKSEKGKTISEKERKEVEANIERLKQSIADAEAADKLVKGEQPTETAPVEGTTVVEEAPIGWIQKPVKIKEDVYRFEDSQGIGYIVRRLVGERITPMWIVSNHEEGIWDGSHHPFKTKDQAIKYIESFFQKPTFSQATTSGIPKEFTKEGGNKIVGEDGNPIKLFHGTQSEFDEYQFPSFFGDVQYATEGGAEMAMGGIKAVFFSSNKDSATTYSQLDKSKKSFVKEAYVSMQNPIVIDAKGKNWTGRVADDYKLALKQIKDGAKNKDGKPYDGVIVKNVIDSASDKPHVGDVYMVTDPKKIYNLDTKPEQIIAKTETKTITETETEAKENAAIKKRIEALDPNESQGYQVDRLRAAKEDMLAQPERAIMAMQAMDFFTEFYGRNDKQYIEYAKKHPLSTVTQYFYNSENSVIDMVREQISGKKFDIIRIREQINSLGKGKKDAQLKASYEQSIKDAEQYVKDIKVAYNEFAKENGLEVLLAEHKTTETETTTETEPEAPAQYIPLTSKDIEIGKFSKDEAVEYETDEKELESGRMSEYISSMTVEVLNDDGNTVGFLTKLKDEDGTVTWQSSNESGDELGIDEAFDTKQEAIQALLDDYNKEQSKEFAKEQKRLAKEAEKKAAKEQKKEPAVEPEKTDEDKKESKTETKFNWDKKPDKKEIQLLLSKLTQEQLDKGFYYGVAPDSTYKTIYNRLRLALGDNEKANAFLLENGINWGKPQEAKVETKLAEATPEQAERSQMAMMDDIMDTERTKPAAAKEMRDQFIEQHGKEVFDKLNKITRNFEQIINTLEKEGKCIKKC
jgi:hypothetical protein